MELLKLTEVAQELGISEPTARRYVKTGKLASVFVGGRYRVRRDVVDEFLRQAEVRPGEDLPKAQAASTAVRQQSEIVDREVQALRRWMTYLEPRLAAHTLTADELKHELDAAIAFGKPAKALQSANFDRFMALVGGMFEEAKRFDGLQAELAGLEVATFLEPRHSEAHGEAS